MNLAIISESASDEAALKILVDAIIGEETQLVSTRTRPGGWPHVLQLLPSIIKALHYGGETDGLVIVVDSDDSPIHYGQSDIRVPCNPRCRLCEVRSCLALVITRLANVVNRASLKTAVGLAVPAIEAWYQCGNHVNENTWRRGLDGERLLYDRRSLKLAVYGSRQLSLEAATKASEAAARQLANDLDLLERLFPIGFGCLLLDLRQW
jgi:hypothetical protein